MTAAATASAAPRAAREQSPLDVFRDDGPLARALGRALGPLVPAPALALRVAAVVVAGAVVAAAGTEGSDAAAGAAVAAAVLGGGIATGRPPVGRFRWSGPPLVRLLEYGLLLWLALRVDAADSCFALLAALAFRHYEAVYRGRAQGVPPPAWLRLTGGGWDGRLVAAYALTLLGALSTGMIVAAIALAVVSVGESIASWLRFERAAATALHDDEEDDEQ